MDQLIKSNSEELSSSGKIVENTWKAKKRKRNDDDSESSFSTSSNASSLDEEDPNASYLCSSDNFMAKNFPIKRKDSFQSDDQVASTSKKQKTLIDNIEMPSDGLKLNQHGPDYQLNILMRVLWRAKDCDFFQFRLATELPGAEKLDDVVFQYCSQLNDCWKFRLFQIKHKEGANIQLIDKANLLSLDDDKEFAISKYFKSFINVEERCKQKSVYSSFSDGKVEDVCLITNTDFCSEELRSYFTNDMEDIKNDKLLGFNDIYKACSYTITAGTELAMTLIPILSATSDLSRLVQTLAYHLVNGIRIDKTMSILKNFIYPLMNDVFICARVEDGFVLQFSKNFLENPNPNKDVQIFRDALLKEIAFLKYSWKLKVSSKFGECQLPNDFSGLEELACKLASSIDSSEELKSQDFANSQTILATEVVNCSTEKFRSAFIKPEKEQLRSFRNLVKEELGRLRGVKKLTNKDLECVEIKISPNFGEIGFPSDPYVINQIANSLFDAWLTGKQLDSSFDGPFELYQHSLAKDVIDVSSGTFYDAFIKGDQSNATISANILEFRRVLIHKIITIDILKEFQDFFANAKLPISKGLASDFLVKTDLILENPKKFAGQFHSLFTSNTSCEKCIELHASKISRSHEELNVFKANICKLGEGHVIVRKFSKLRFSSNFIEMRDLIENFNDFREELVSLLGDASLNHFAEYTFKIDIEGFRCHEEEFSLKSLPQPYKPEDFDNFFKKFKLVLNYPNRFQISGLLEREMREQFQSLNSKAFRALYQDNLQKWMSERFGTFYTIEKARQLFQAVDQDIICWRTDGISRSYFASVPMKYVFRTSENRIRDFLCNSNDQMLCLVFEHLLLGRIRITQSFHKLRLDNTLECQKYTHIFGYIFLTLHQLQTLVQQEEVLKTFNEEDQWNLVVVEWDIQKNSEKVLERIRQLLSLNPVRKFIFISTRKDESSTEIEGDCFLYRNPTQELIKTDFTDLTENSQKLISEKGKLYLQKSMLTVNDLIDSETKTLIDGMTLVKFIKRRKVKIGCKLHFPDDYDPSYYVNRFLDLDVEIREEVRLKCSDVLVISDKEEDYLEACESFDGKKRRSIHWLREIHGKLYWQKSLGSIKQLVKYRYIDATYRVDVNNKLVKIETYRSSMKSLAEKDLTTISDCSKLIIISNNAGMGKSTILSNLSKHFKNCYPHAWVIRVDLNDYSSFFMKELTNRNLKKPMLRAGDINAAIEFMVKLLESNKKSMLKTDFEVNLLVRALHRPLKLKLVLLFDGFDEISPTYKDIILDLLLYLKHTCVEKVMITTRPYMQQNLERSLEMFACSLQQFTKSDQIYFLTNFLRKRITMKHLNSTVSSSVFDSRLQTYVNCLIQKQADTINDKQMEFTGVPLQLRLLAEIFEESEEGCDWQGCYDFVNSDNLQPKLPDRLNVFDLYTKFTEKKYFIYRKDKMRQDLTNVATEIESLDSFKTFVKQHRKMAVYALFDSQSDLNVLLSLFGDYDEQMEEIETYLQKIESGKEMRGIINQVVASKPQFIHRTFAEFFIADFIGCTLMRRSQSLEFLNLLVKKVFACIVEFKSIAAFFDKWLEITRLKIPQSTIEKLGGCIVGLWENSDKQWSEFFHNPCENGYIEIIKLICDSLGGHVDSLQEIVNSFWNNRTALYRANVIGSLDLVKLLVEHGADVNATINKETVLQNSASNRRLHIAKWLAMPKANGGGGADVHTTWHFGRSTLDAAIYSGDLEFCERIAALGVSLDSVDDAGRTPLHAAALVGNLPLVKWLISKGVNKEACDKRGYNALNYASSTGKLDVCDWLVLPNESGGGGLDINTKTNRGMTMLHTGSTASNLSLLQWLLDRGFLIDSTDDLGRTPLLLAAQLGHLKVIRWLLNKGADIHAVTIDGKTILHLAASAHKPDACEWLIENDLNPDLPDSNGMLPIQLAASKGHLKLVQKLLAGKEPSYGTHSNGDTLLHFAALSGKIEMCEWLLQCDQLVKAGLHVNSRGKNGRTALHLSMQKNLRLIRGLLENGADVNCKDENGCTIVHYAAGFGELEIFKFLIKHPSEGGLGLDCAVKTFDKSTVLHLSMENGNLAFCKYLVDMIELDINAMNDKGETAVNIAERNKHAEVVSWLLERSSETRMK